MLPYSNWKMTCQSKDSVCLIGARYILLNISLISSVEYVKISQAKRPKDPFSYSKYHKKIKVFSCALANRGTYNMELTYLTWAKFKMSEGLVGPSSEISGRASPAGLSAEASSTKEP